MKHIATTTFLLVLLALAVGCKEDSSSGDTTDTVDTTGAAEPGGSAFALSESGSLDQEAASKFARTWVKAFNARDWSTLEAMWASDAQIEYRRGRLQENVSVDVWKSQLGGRAQDELKFGLESETDFAPLPDGAFVRLNGEVKSEETTFYTGEWDMLVRYIDGTAQIALQAEREPRFKTQSAPSRHLGSLVTVDGVLLQNQPSLDAERGYRTLVNATGVAELWVDDSKLPLEWQRFAGKSFEVWDASGEKCQAEVLGYRYYAQVEAPEWVTAGWSGDLNDKKAQRTAGEAAWTMAGEEGRTLVAKFEPGSLARCENPIWARMSGTTPPTLFPEVERPELVEKMLEAFESLEYVRKTQKSMERSGQPGTWWTEGAFETHIFSDGSRTFGTVTASGGEPCNAISPRVFAIWEVFEGNTWSLLTDDTSAGEAFYPRFVTDVNGDGSPEFFGEQMTVREAGGTYRVVEDVRPIDLDGGC